MVTDAPAHSPIFSVVIPSFNEEPNIAPLLERLQKMFGQMKCHDYEIIFVENGSSDGSAALLCRLSQKDDRIRPVYLSRNFGYQGAITSGLAAVRGQWIVIMDGDQQDPPELIPDLHRKATEGFDVVYGVRRRREGNPIKILCYKLFYRFWRLMASIEVPLDAGDFCLMNRRVVTTINSMPERNRFMRGLRSWVGFRQTGISYDRPDRAEGETKFNIAGMFGLAFDGIIAFSVHPLRLALGLGVLTTLCAMGLAILQAIMKICEWVGWLPKGTFPPGITQLNIIILGLFGANMLILGIVGEYVGRIYEEVKRRPHYVLRPPPSPGSQEPAERASGQNS